MGGPADDGGIEPAPCWPCTNCTISGITAAFSAGDSPAMNAVNFSINGSMDNPRTGYGRCGDWIATNGPFVPGWGN